jgi:hypothetical protein
MRPALLAFLVVLAACSPSESDVTTTEQSSGADASTTTSEATTTTLALPTTTVVVTTSTSVESTTTTFVETGNWADQPLITTGFGALGWWDGAKWVLATQQNLPVVGGEDYQIAGIGLRAITTGGPQTLVCEPLDNIGVVLQNDHLLGEWPGPYGVAVSAPWEIYPHLVEEFQDDGTYAAIASGLLADRGLNVPNPSVKQLFRTDIEGDGTNEVIVVVEHISASYLAEVGDYSIAFMQKVVQGDVQTAIIDESVVTEPENAFVVGFTIGSIADLSGDGVMELVVDAAYYEGFGVELWEYVDDDIGLIKFLETGCGS